MKIISEPLHKCFVLKSTKSCDNRGSFVKTFNDNVFLDLGINFKVKEQFISKSKKNVIRGLHFQKPPFEHDKIVFCSRGNVIDVLVDLRKHSKTFLKTFSIELDSEVDEYIFIPAGVAHGFLSKQDDSELIYLTSTVHEPEYDSGIHYNSINFNWPISQPIVSDRDLKLPSLSEFLTTNTFEINECFNLPKVAYVTGATGFIGSRLVKRLVQQNWDVTVIVRPSSSLFELNEIIDKVTIFYYDKFESLKTLFELNKPSIVFHIASKTFYDYKPEELDDIIASNITLGVQILDLMHENGVKYFVNTGTSWQHYQNADYNPVNLYAATKEAFEKILDYYSIVKGVQAITLKLFDTYGVNDPRPKLVNLLLNYAKDNRELNLSEGDQILNFASINDVINAYEKTVLLFDKKSKGKHIYYAVPGNDTISIKDLVKLFNSISPKKVKVNFGIKKYRDREVMDPWKTFQTLPNHEPSKDSIKNYFMDICKDFI